MNPEYRFRELSGMWVAKAGEGLRALPWDGSLDGDHEALGRFDDLAQDKSEGNLDPRIEEFLGSIPEWSEFLHLREGDAQMDEILGWERAEIDDMAWSDD